MKSLFFGTLIMIACSALQLTASCSERFAHNGASNKNNTPMVKELIAFEYTHHHGSMIFTTDDYRGSMDYRCEVKRNEQGEYVLTTSKWNWDEKLKMVHDTIVLPDTTIQNIIGIVNSCKLYEMPSYIEVDPEYSPLDAGGWSASLQVDTFSTSLHFGDGEAPLHKKDDLYVGGVLSIVSMLKNSVE